MKKSLKNTLKIAPAKLADFNKLARYHYRKEPINPTSSIYKVSLIGEDRSSFPDPIAVIAYKTPIPFLTGRTLATGNFFTKEKSLSARLKKVNKYIRYAARLIVDPRFDKIGIGSWLLFESMRKQPTPFVEALSPIDFTNKILERCGFVRFVQPDTPRYSRIRKAFFKLGLKEHNLTQPVIVQRRLDLLSQARAGLMEHEIIVFMRGFQTNKKFATGLERTRYILEKINFPRAYFLWHNPESQNFPEIAGDPHDKAEHFCKTTLYHTR